MEYSKLSFDELLRPEGYDDGCGVHHSCPLKFLRIERDAVNTIPECFDRLGFTKPFVVADPNTEKAAWFKVKAVLEKAGIPYSYFCFAEDHPEPAEYSMGAIAMAFDNTCDVIMAVGSGVINDCCKVLARVTGKPSISIATAPSMDGYASDGSSMVIAGVKGHISVPCPVAVIADTLILKDAPARMLWSGLGDMLAKYVALCEWRITNIINDEYYCPDVATLMRDSLNKLVAAAPHLMDRDPETIGAIMEGLVLSGIAMAFVHVSRPASGLEHYFSHIWEMMVMSGKIPFDTHGIQVGVGTYLVMDLYDQIAKLTPSREKAEAFIASFKPEDWEKGIHEFFGDAAEPILALEKRVGKNDPIKHAKRLERILGHWDDILAAMKAELPPIEQIRSLMETVGMPMLPSDIGYTDENAYDAFYHSRDIRDKYLTSSMLWDLGLLYEMKLKLTRD